MGNTTPKGASLRSGAGAIRVGQVLLGLCLVVCCSWAALAVAQFLQGDITFGTTVSRMTHVLGRPTDRSISISLLAPDDLEAYAEYGVAAARYTGRTGITLRTLGTRCTGSTSRALGTGRAATRDGAGCIDTAGYKGSDCRSIYGTPAVVLGVNCAGS